MSVSVIIPTHNRARQVARAVDSVLAQSVAPQEIIVVDDGSDDDTGAVLAGFADQVRVLRQDNRGVSSARNLGIRAATGEWLALLDSDDWWLADKLAAQLAYHRQHPECRLSQTDEHWQRHGRRVNKAKRFRKKAAGWIFAPSLAMCHVSPSAVLIHRSVFGRVGLFDETLPACEDYDLWLRIARHFEVGLVDEPLIVKTGGHDDQLSRRYWGMDRFRIRAMEKHLDTHPWRREVLVELAEKCGVVAAGAAKRGRRALHVEYDEKRRRYRRLLAIGDAAEDAPGQGR